MAVLFGRGKVACVKTEDRGFLETKEGFCGGRGAYAINSIKKKCVQDTQKEKK